MDEITIVAASGDGRTELWAVAATPMRALVIASSKIRDVRRTIFTAHAQRGSVS
jgi:hypothetical protein